MKFILFRKSLIIIHKRGSMILLNSARWNRVKYLCFGHSLKYYHLVLDTFLQFLLSLASRMKCLCQYLHLYEVIQKSGNFCPTLKCPFRCLKQIYFKFFTNLLLLYKIKNVKKGFPQFLKLCLQNFFSLKSKFICPTNFISNQIKSWIVTISNQVKSNQI